MFNFLHSRCKDHQRFIIVSNASVYNFHKHRIETLEFHVIHTDAIKWCRLVEMCNGIPMLRCNDMVALVWNFFFPQKNRIYDQVSVHILGYNLARRQDERWNIFIFSCNNNRKSSSKPELMLMRENRFFFCFIGGLYPYTDGLFSVFSITASHENFKPVFE